MKKKNRRTLNQREIRGMNELMRNTSSSSVSKSGATDVWSLTPKNYISGNASDCSKKSMRKGLRKCQNVNSDLWTPIKLDSLKCPYCGAKMILKPASSVKTIYKDGELFVCDNYPVCDTYCRSVISTLPKTNGERVLLSTPADKSLRRLRKQAHFYFSAVMELGIYKTNMELYLALGNLIGEFNGTPRHIGECREYGCIKIINTCVGILYNNRGKIKHFKKWRDENASVLTPESQKMIEGIVESVK